MSILPKTSSFLIVSAPSRKPPLVRQTSNSSLCAPGTRMKELLDSIFGIGKATIPHILAELDDLEKFTRVREMVAFIGLAPKETLSRSCMKGKPGLCKIGHARLRKALYMPALVSIQCNPFMIDFYNRLKEQGKNGKVIVYAIMRKLVRVIFGVLKSGTMYDPDYQPNVA